MCFNKRTLFFKLSGLAIILVLLSACASKPLEKPVSAALSAPSEEMLEQQKQLEQFNTALALAKGDKAEQEKAKSLFTALYEANSRYLGALVNAANVALSLGQQDEAKQLYLDVLNNLEKQEVSQTKEAMSENKDIKDQESHETVSLPKEKSANAELFASHSYTQLGLIERHAGNFDLAASYYRKALAIDDKNVVAVKNLAILLDLYQGKLAEAYDMYLRYQALVEESDPKLKDWLYDLKYRLPAEEAVEKSNE